MLTLELALPSLGSLVALLMSFNSLSYQESLCYEILSDKCLQAILKKPKVNCLKVHTIIYPKKSSDHSRQRLGLRIRNPTKCLC